MRVMQDLIEENGLDDELEEAMVEETGNTHFWLGHVNEFDEDSDTPDPEASLKDEVGERRAFCGRSRHDLGRNARADQLRARQKAPKDL